MYEQAQEYKVVQYGGFLKGWFQVRPGASVPANQLGHDGFRFSTKEPMCEQKKLENVLARYWTRSRPVLGT